MQCSFYPQPIHGPKNQVRISLILSLTGPLCFNTFLLSPLPDHLFASIPHNMTFRLAYITIIKLTTPPSHTMSPTALFLSSALQNTVPRQKHSRGPPAGKIDKKTTQTHSNTHQYTPTFTQNKHLPPQTATQFITLLIYTAFKLQQGLQPRLSNSKTQTPVASLCSPAYPTLSRKCTLIIPADWLLEGQFHIQRSPRTPCWTSSPTMLQANNTLL